MDRLSKFVVLVWTCATIAFQIRLLSRGWPELPLLAAAVVTLMLAIGAFQRKAVALVLAISYVFPVLIRQIHVSAPYAPYDGLWIAALVALMLPDLVRTPWRLPRRWRVPLVAAVLIVATTSPIIVLREIDLNPGLLADRTAWNWISGAWPSVRVSWILHASLTLVVGVLWFDWLLGASDLNFQKVVVTPLVISASLLAAVCVYQLVFDLKFLNQTIYASMGRASGTLYDANVSGVIAAMWIGGTFLWAREWPRYRWAIVVVGTLGFWLAVWATGSRTALLVAACSTLFVAVALLIEPGRSRARVFQLAAAAVLLTALVGIVARSSPGVAGPISRLRAQLPTARIAAIRAFSVKMWDRDGYGAAATAVIRDVPLFGIGIGSFHSIGGDYVGENGWEPDNAQNWLRHQVAELGAIGSLGWVVWFVAFGAFVCRVRRSDTGATWVTRGTLIGFAGISMLSMPGQHVMVTITFWTMAFWYVLAIAGRPEQEPPLPAWIWSIVGAIAIIAAVGTADLAMTRLRAPARAQAADRSYGYGFSTPAAAGKQCGYRLARSHAVAVVSAPYQWLSISVRLDDRTHPPVDVRMWINGETLLKGRLVDDVPLSALIRVPVAPRHILLEAGARRADSSRPFFMRSVESLYLAKWEFLEDPPVTVNGFTCAS